VDSNFLIFSGAGARWTRDFLKNFLKQEPQYKASGGTGEGAGRFYAAAVVPAIA
jgi:hypothetical protein